MESPDTAHAPAVAQRANSACEHFERISNAGTKFLFTAATIPFSASPGRAQYMHWHESCTTAQSASARQPWKRASTCPAAPAGVPGGLRSQTRSTQVDIEGFFAQPVLRETQRASAPQSESFAQFLGISALGAGRLQNIGA
jgi:hypothetical protein